MLGPLARPITRLEPARASASPLGSTPAAQPPPRYEVMKMNEEVSELIEESVQLELNVAELYLVFYHAFPDDADFWWRLVMEEKNHAALIRSIEEGFMPAGILPGELLSSSVDKIREANTAIVTLITRFKTAPPSRGDAFSIAHKLEESAGEIHFQTFMKKEAESGIDEMFQRLNRADKDHASRIRSYMEKHGIESQEGIDDTPHNNAMQPDG